MRIGLTLLLVTGLGACGTNGTGGGDDGGGDDGTTTPDGGDTIPPPKRGFQLVSPDIDIPAGQEITYCWYFRTPNTETMAIKRWQSHMTGGSHHMIMFLTGNTDAKPPGTVSADGCGVGLQAVWTYAAQNVDADLALPTDDGAGKPLGQEIPANTGGFLQMHYLNATDNPIKVHVTVNADAHEANVAFTKTAAFVTYNATINIPAHAGEAGSGIPAKVETRACNTPAGTKFWMMSTHAHKQATVMSVKDSASMVFTSDDWEHPGAKMYAAPTFYSFASGKITYECTYVNDGTNKNNVIRSGDSAATNEMCMASGYYFPATGPKFCIDNQNF